MNLLASHEAFQETLFAAQTMGDSGLRMGGAVVFGAFSCLLARRVYAGYRQQLQEQAFRDNPEEITLQRYLAKENADYEAGQAEKLTEFMRGLRPSEPEES